MEKEKVIYESIDDLAEEFEIYFNECLSGKAPVAFVSRQRWKPSIDLYETPDGFHLFLELGGLDVKDIHCEYEDGSLRVHGKRVRFTSGSIVDFHRVEINAGPFERKIKFKAPVDPQSIKAGYQDGILRVELKKAARQKPGRFPVPIASL